jgi:two-component system nitrate/nitrite response regulator NarL
MSFVGIQTDNSPTLCLHFLNRKVKQGARMAAQTLTLVHDRSSQADPEPSSLNPAIPTALICDNALLRSGLQQILSGSLFAIVEAASITGPKRLQYCAPNTGLVIIEATQNTSRVLEVIRQVRERSPEARIVVLADRFDLEFVRSGHEAGVHGFCSAASDPAILIKALELVVLGESVLPFQVVRSIMDAAPQNQGQPLQRKATEPKLSDLKECKLSERETQVLIYLRQGAPNKIIARQFDLTEATIKVHVKAILRKIGAANRTQAAMWASQHLPQRGGASVNV